ncbi:four helix bundle protein [Candidatus Parcubacteria bacterium]|nr:MAG: four helix bundle protein [Candidatus Parcubacteria bacterium]
MTTITKFCDIIAWQKAHKLVLKVYKTTKYFPKEELYAITSQIRRASTSIAANIVEGFYRKTKKDRLRFYEIAMSSLEETKYFILLSKDLEYITITEARNLYKIANELGKVLRGWIKIQN